MQSLQKRNAINYHEIETDGGSHKIFIKADIKFKKINPGPGLFR